MTDINKYYFVKAKGLRHIAQKSGVWTLCRNIYNDYNVRFDTGDSTVHKVTGKERYKKGRDCKTCFRKAKLRIGGK